MFNRKNISIILERIIEIGILTIVVLSPLPFGSVQPWSITVFEVAIFFLAICWAIQIYIGVNNPIRIPLLGWVLIGLFVLAFFQTIRIPLGILQILSPKGVQIYQEVGTNIYKGKSISLYPYSTIQELFKLMSYLIFYILVINRNNNKFFLKVIIAVIGITFFETFYGLFEFFSEHYKIFWYSNSVSVGNTSGTFINKNHYAVFLEMGIFLSLGFFISKITKMVKDVKGIKGLILVIFSEKNISYLLILFSSGLAITAVIFSGSKAGIVLILSGLVFYLFLVSFFYGNSIGKYLILILLFISILSPIFFSIKDLKGIVEQFRQNGLMQKDVRNDIFKDSSHLANDFFVTGCGLGAYQYVFPLYNFKTKISLSLWNNNYVDHAHNEYLELICETGFVGLIISLIGGLVTFLRALYGMNILKLGIIIGLGSVTLHNFVDFGLHIPSIALMYLCLIGVMSVDVKNWELTG